MSEAAALLRRVLARMIHEDLAHQPRRRAEEVRAVLPINVLLVNQSQICLMD